MNKIKKILLIIYTFYLLYLPNYGYINMLLQPSSILLIMASLNVVLLNKRLYSFIKEAKLYKLLFIILILLVYLYFINATNNYDLNDLVSNIVVTYNIINYISLIIWYDKLYSKEGMPEYLISIGLFQAMLSYLMIFVEPLKTIANNMYLNSENPGLNLLGITDTRIYGIGSGYTVTLPFIQALLAIMALQLFTQTGKIKYFIFSVLLIGSSALNNRTGMMIYALILFIYLIKWFITKLTLKRILFTNAIILSLIIGIFIVFRDEDSVWMQWIAVAFEDAITYFIHGEATGNFLLLAGSFITYPVGIRLWIGTGHRVFGQSGLEKFGVSSDIGYINDIYKGGILYILILYLVFFSDIVKRIDDKFYSSILIIFLLLTNYKAEQMNGSATLLIILLLGFENTYQKLKKENNTLAYS